MTDNDYRPEDTLPARRSQLPPIAAAPAAESYDDDYGGGGGPQGKKVGVRTVLRALKRYWWQAMMVWMLLSGGLMALAYQRVKPSYDAVAQVLIELGGDLKIFTNTNSGTQLDFTQIMEMQAANLANPLVLGTALADHPELVNLPSLAGSPDAELELKKMIQVAVIPKTPYIQVMMSSPTPGEAAQIVNAVVDAYLKYAKSLYEQSSENRIRQLKEWVTATEEKVSQDRKLVKSFQERIGLADEKALKDRNLTSIDTYKRLNESLTTVELQRLSVQAKIDQYRSDKLGPVRELDDKQVETMLTEAFYSEPQVDALQKEYERAEARYQEATRLSRNPSDPSVVAAKKKRDGVADKKNELWVKLRPKLQRKILSGPADANTERQLQDAEAELAALITHEANLRAKLESARIESKAADDEALQLEYVRNDLQRDQTTLDRVRANYDQATYEAKSPAVKATLSFHGKATNRPSHERRIQAMAAAPVAVGLLMLAGLVLFELRGARVSDPEELADRMNIQVIGVVPPLPQIRVGSSGGGDGGAPALASSAKTQRQIDEFLQSLDHLRVTLCARPDRWGRDKHCVLITSACSGEGKTTLASQLATRCVNAGMMTLLVDADMRNPTLSRMLDAVESPGLMNVLREDVAPEDVIVHRPDAGGFHMLSVGTPLVDPSRFLHGDRLRTLLDRARMSFDMIIVDSPPVLPVPDALLIGRWTDGAVLAVRHDKSRFPLVERASRRLAHVGVPIIGAVVNGVRSMESSYGGYYAYGYGSYGNSYGATSVPPAETFDA